MRRVGKIRSRKVFPKVKNVNVESLKIGSKLLDFWNMTIQKLMRNLMRQLMGINGETVLAGSASG